MFLPLHDNTRLRIIRFQYVTGLLMVINLVVFGITHYELSGTAENASATSLGFIPAVVAGRAQLGSGLEWVPPAGTFLTYMFFHYGWLHLITNLLFLWVFADNIEDIFGHTGFLLFYLGCGALAATVHLLTDLGSQTPLVGASGAVSGVLAAYMILFPRAKIWILLIFYIPVRISALIAVVAWFIFQIASLWFSPEDVAVAWWAHIGGFGAGLLITLAARPVFVRRFEGR